MAQDDPFAPASDAAGAGMAPHPEITPPAEVAQDLQEQMHADEMGQAHDSGVEHDRQYRLRDPDAMR